MTDIDLAQPVDTDSLAAYQTRGPSLLQRQINLLTRLNTFSLGLNFVLGACVLMLSAAIVIMMPLKKFLPVFFGFNGEVVESVTDVSQLPQDKEADVVKSVLWTLTKNWQEYTGRKDAKGRWDIVSALTMGKAQQDYQQWLINDPGSPLNKIGDNIGRIDAREVPNSAVFQDDLPVCKRTEWCGATLAFWRRDQISGQTSGEKRWTASMRFVFTDTLDAGEKTSINPAHIKVFDFHTECDDCGG